MKRLVAQFAEQRAEAVDLDAEIAKNLVRRNVDWIKVTDP